MTLQKIDLTGINLVRLLRVAYDLSIPLGMGNIHFRPGPLPIDEAHEVVRRQSDLLPDMVLTVDYLHGRSIKLHVRKEHIDGAERWWMYNDWLDHSRDQIDVLVSKARGEYE